MTRCQSCQVHECGGVLKCPVLTCRYRARPEHKPSALVAPVCQICPGQQLLIRVECGVKTITTTDGNHVEIVVERNHDHEMPPVAKLLPSTKLAVKKMVMDGQPASGAVCNYLQKFAHDAAALQEERVNTFVRKAHKDLFGEDLDFGGLQRLTQQIIKEDYVRDAVQNISEPSKTICFVQTKFQQELIKTCDYLFADISYKLCRLYYKMVITGFNHVTRKGAVVATAYLQRADTVSYEVCFSSLFRHNPGLITVTSNTITLNFTMCVDFSDAQRKGLLNAVIKFARDKGCLLAHDEIGKELMLSLKGCNFHFQQSVTKVARSGALLHNSAKNVFGSLVTAWTASEDMATFIERKNRLVKQYPTVKGWITWWALPVHAVMLFPGVRQDLLQETDEMYGHLPSTNNTAEATNSIESRLARHNAELIPSIHDSYRMTLRQQQQHEGILSGAPLLPEFTLFLLMTHCLPQVR